MGTEFQFNGEGWFLYKDDVYKCTVMDLPDYETHPLKIVRLEDRGTWLVFQAVVGEALFPTYEGAMRALIRDLEETKRCLTRKIEVRKQQLRLALADSQKEKKRGSTGNL